jgi:uncharacterized protein YegP (UPF0339 family)
VSNGINTDNDKVQVYEDAVGEYRWRRVDTGNGKIVATSGEGYTDLDYALAAALAYNYGVVVVDLTSEES